MKKKFPTPRLILPPDYPFLPVTTKAFELLTSRSLPKVCIVTAPPGSGKTVLLTHLFRLSKSSGADALWIAPDAASQGPMQLIDLVEQALSIDCTDAAAPIATPQRIDSIVARLAESTAGLTICIDNADFCTSPESEQLLNALIFRSPVNVHLIASSTGKLRINTTSALLELRLRKITQTALWFNVENIEQLLADAGMENESLRQQAPWVLEKSEGWPAAARLMQVIAAAEPGARLGIERFQRDGLQMVDSLLGGKIANLPEDRRRFIFQIADLNQFCPALAQFATGRLDVQNHIDQLVDDNFLITSTGGDWYRFHGLFRQYLIACAGAHVTAASRREVLLRASQWLERAGHLAAALELAIRADEKSVVTRILDAMSRSLVRDLGDLPSFITSVQQTHSIDAALGSEAHFWYLWALIFERRYEAAQTELRGLQQVVAGTRALPAETAHDLLAKAILAKIALKLHLDDLLSVKEGAKEWRDCKSREDGFESGAVAGAEAFALLACNEIAAAKAAARCSMSAVAGSVSLYGRGWAANIAAGVAIAAGNPQAALGGLADLEREMVSRIGEGAIVTAVTGVVHARALFACGRIDQAITLVERNWPVARRCGIVDFNWQAFEVLLPAILAGRSKFSLADLKAVARTYPRRLGFLLDLKMIRLLLHGGQLREAVDLACDLGIWTATGRFSATADSVLEMEKTAVRMVGICLHMVSGDTKTAETMIAQEISHAQDLGLLPNEIDLHLTHAWLHHRNCNWKMVLRSFGRAVELSAERRFLQPFYEHANLVKLILGHAKIKDIGVVTMAASKMLEDIQALVGHESGKEPAPTESATVLNPLSQREHELLLLLADGLDNAQIAQTLFIALPTVKWHLSNLYSKLNVKNRTSALAKARSLRWI